MLGSKYQEAQPLSSCEKKIFISRIFQPVLKHSKSKIPSNIRVFSVKKMKSDSEPFNLLKRVIMLEERTKTYEESQVRLSFLEQQVSEMLKENTSASPDKQIVELQDKIEQFNQKYGALIDQIHDQIKQLVNIPCSIDLQTEFDNINQVLVKMDAQTNLRLEKQKEEVERSLFQLNKHYKDLLSATDKQAYQIYEIQKKQENKKMEDLFSSRANLQSAGRVVTLPDQREISTEKRFDLLQRQIVNKESASKSNLSIQDKSPKAGAFSSQQKPNNSKQEESINMSVLSRDLSGYRLNRQNPYRPSTNIRERPLITVNEHQFEQTRRFIDEEINRRVKEEKEKKQQKQVRNTYTSLRDQFQKKFF